MLKYNAYYHVYYTGQDFYISIWDIGQDVGKSQPSKFFYLLAEVNEITIHLHLGQTSFEKY